MTFPSSITYAARVLFIWTATARGIQSAVSVIYSVLYRTVGLYYFHTFTYYNFMFKTVLKNVVCIYHYMGKNKIDSDVNVK